MKAKKFPQHADKWDNLTGFAMTKRNRAIELQANEQRQMVLDAYVAGKCDGKSKLANGSEEYYKEKYGNHEN